MSLVADATPIRAASGWKVPTQLGLDKGKFPYLTSYNPKYACLTFEKVLDWIKKPVTEDVVVLDHTKGVLIATPTTQILCANFEYAPLGEIMPGDQLIFFKDARSLERKAANEHKAALSKLVTEVRAVYYLVGYSSAMYGFRTEGDNSFVANGLIIRGF